MRKPTNSATARNTSSNHLRCKRLMRLLLAANNQATRRKLQVGSSSNRYALRLPQQETKSSTKQLAPTDPILGPENLLKTGFAQKGLPSLAKEKKSEQTTPQKCHTVICEQRLLPTWETHGWFIFLPPLPPTKKKGQHGRPMTGP